jgi:hypothetical protein
MQVAEKWDALMLTVREAIAFGYAELATLGNELDGWSGCAYEPGRGFPSIRVSGVGRIRRGLLLNFS